jgi:hypothetical protein
MDMTKALFAFVMIMAVAIQVNSAAPHPESVPMKIVNMANAPLDLFWVNTFVKDEPMVRQVSKPIRNSSDTIINSYDTHKFMIRYYSAKHGKSEVFFHKGPMEETVTVYSTNGNDVGDLTVVQNTKYDDIKGTVKGATRACMHIEDGAGFDACVAEEVCHVSTSPMLLSLPYPAAYTCLTWLLTNPSTLTGALALRTDVNPTTLHRTTPHHTTPHHTTPHYTTPHHTTPHHTTPHHATLRHGPH